MLIGLVGYAGVGKDTVGSLLVDEGYERRAFGDKLRELALELNPAFFVDDDSDGETEFLADIVDHLGWDEAKRQCPSVRRYLQTLGQAQRKVFGEDSWVDAVLFNPSKDSVHSPLTGIEQLGDYVVTDVRQPNEAQRIIDLGGQLWVVERPGFGPVNDHETERYPSWIGNHEHTIIENSGTIEDLSRAIDALLYCSCLRRSTALCPVHLAYAR